MEFITAGLEMMLTVLQGYRPFPTYVEHQEKFAKPLYRFGILFLIPASFPCAFNFVTYNRPTSLVLDMRTCPQKDGAIRGPNSIRILPIVFLSVLLESLNRQLVH